jgi:hypothetical protein
MKKILFLASLAAVAMTSCTSESNEYVGGNDNTPKEIALFPVNQKATRAAITNGVFPTDKSMEVAAYTGGKGQLFAHSTFSHSAGTIWSGGKYWPLSPCFVNFLAYANLTSGTATWGTPSNNDDASKVVLEMADNATTQNDLLYAVAQGQVQQDGNALSFPPNVPMAFKHAQSLLTFNLKAADAASQTITINSISLINAHFSGTYTIDNASNYNVSTSASPSVTGSWTTVGGATATQAVSVSGALSETRTGQIMVVPNGASAAFDKFVINYTLSGVAYSFEYTPSDRVLAEGKNYVYDITFKLHEILIDASVASWIESTEYINIPTMTYGANPTYDLANGAKGTYTFTISGLTVGHFVKVTDNRTSTGKFTVTSPASTYTVPANGTVTITGTLADNEGSAATSVITLKQYPSSDDASADTNEETTFATTITITQAGS